MTGVTFDTNIGNTLSPRSQSMVPSFSTQLANIGKFDGLDMQNIPGFQNNIDPNNSLGIGGIDSFFDSLSKYGGLANNIFGSFLNLSAVNEAKAQNKFNRKITLSNQADQRKLTNERLRTRDLSREQRGFDDGLSNAQFMQKFGLGDQSTNSIPVQDTNPNTASLSRFGI